MWNLAQSSGFNCLKTRALLYYKLSHIPIHKCGSDTQGKALDS